MTQDFGGAVNKTRHSPVVLVQHGGMARQNEARCGGVWQTTARYNTVWCANVWDAAQGPEKNTFLRPAIFMANSGKVAKKLLVRHNSSSLSSFTIDPGSADRQLTFNLRHTCMRSCLRERINSNDQHNLQPRMYTALVANDSSGQTKSHRPRIESNGANALSSAVRKGEGGRKHENVMKLYIVAKERCPSTLGQPSELAGTSTPVRLVYLPNKRPTFVDRERRGREGLFPRTQNKPMSAVQYRDCRHPVLDLLFAAVGLFLCSFGCFTLQYW